MLFVVTVIWFATDQSSDRKACRNGSANNRVVVIVPQDIAMMLPVVMMMIAAMMSIAMMPATMMPSTVMPSAVVTTTVSTAMPAAAAVTTATMSIYGSGAKQCCYRCNCYRLSK